ncbi:hypothetical protein [Blastococcus sp. TF02A-35]|uniref:hypothetical protein n=1 Tax=Blastococcus sp. TF02A-35 TaxID=2559612 RepID=UPI001073126A|nr:hypothetical protein [Blastococcus sp. TF02A_35]TFV49405.1 hypothetical protein E4P43_12620 [Blastococcus sp. TF02A_35]
MNRALRVATLGVLLLSPLALSGCSAGQVTQTATQDRDKAGAMARVGDITLRQANLAYPDGGRYEEGDDATLVLAIVNGATEADTLTEITGEGFDEAVIQTAGAAGPSTSTAPTTTASPATPSAPGTGTATGTVAPTTTAAPTAAASTELEIPAGSSVFVGQDGAATITLTGLEESLTTGGVIELTLVFENAGEVTLLVPVGTPGEELERGEAFDFHQEESHGGGGSGDSHDENSGHEGGE